MTVANLTEDQLAAIHRSDSYAKALLPRLLAIRIAVFSQWV